MINIRVANKKGFVELKDGGVADLLYPSSKTRRGRVIDSGMTSPTVTSETNGICQIHEDAEYEYRIRKLTSLECWRIMNFSDDDWLAANYGGRDKIQAADPQYDKSSVTAWAVSEPERIEMAKTNLYRQAGNSIVRGVLMAIFSQMGIQGIKKWNDMNDSERYSLIYRGCFVNDGQASASECN
jgi:DNA (cytosine-5)-methyltransferase 1